MQVCNISDTMSAATPTSLEHEQQQTELMQHDGTCHVTKKKKKNKRTRCKMQCGVHWRWTHASRVEFLNPYMQYSGTVKHMYITLGVYICCSTCSVIIVLYTTRTFLRVLLAQRTPCCCCCSRTQQSATRTTRRCISAFRVVDDRTKKARQTPPPPPPAASTPNAMLYVVYTWNAECLCGDGGVWRHVCDQGPARSSVHRAQNRRHTPTFPPNAVQRSAGPYLRVCLAYHTGWCIRSCVCAIFKHAYVHNIEWTKWERAL